MMIDLEPAARGIAASVTALRDDQLGAPTPCPAYTVGDLVEHIGGLAIAFTGAATKAGGPTVSQAPAGDAARLGADWQTRIPADLLTMAAAWRDPAAWTGMTMAGGVDLPGEVAGAGCPGRDLPSRLGSRCFHRAALRLRRCLAGGRARVRAGGGDARSRGHAGRNLRACCRRAAGRAVARSRPRAGRARPQLVGPITTMRPD